MTKPNLNTWCPESDNLDNKRAVLEFLQESLGFMLTEGATGSQLPSHSANGENNSTWIAKQLNLSSGFLLSSWITTFLGRCGGWVVDRTDYGWKGLWFLISGMVTLLNKEALKDLHLTLLYLIQGYWARPLEMSVGKTLERSDKISSLNNPKNSSPIEITVKYVCKGQDRGRNDAGNEAIGTIKGCKATVIVFMWQRQSYMCK